MATRAQNLRTARLLARLRYGPQADALTMLLRDARQQRNIAISNADQGAKGFAASIASLQPQFDQSYAQANALRQQGQQEAQAGLGGIGSSAVTDAIRAAMAREQSGAVSRSGDAQGRDTRELLQRSLDAKAGAIGEQRQARDQYSRDSAKIGTQLQNLIGDQGAFIATQFSDLSQKDRDMAIKRANLRLSRERNQITREGQSISQQNADTAGQSLTERQRHDRAMERNARRNKGKGRGGKPTSGLGSLTQLQQNDAVNQIESAASWARRLQAKKIPLGRIYDALRSGETIKDESGATTKIPAFDHTYVNAAVDILAHGHITKPNVIALHGAGVHIPSRYRHHKTRP